MVSVLFWNFAVVNHVQQVKDFMISREKKIGLSEVCVA